MQETSLQSCKARIKIFAYPGLASLLRSRFLGCHATLPPKETAAMG